ncbi:glucose dehydrogenase [FAD, quinone]-like [Hermetia illucens]|uniref:glucose dehydrogenase [FAD, quinone]-like n=1 Tax=Hermetia illucens TaxID=343691 RepID=UPI0018CC1E93|nr:glucose dehydrogenase [FAD, quinone]-like [Hermetia illucens]XP_037916930.1 glucose dehydrogenase [FAD, quinone]-like [Hermetia illucens]
MNISVESLNPQCAARSLGPANAAINTLLQTLLAAQCGLTGCQKWPENYGPHYVNKGSEIFDFVVIGSGPGGSVVAGRLSENPDYRVLLIEAGDNPPVESEIPNMAQALQGGRVDWNYTTEPNYKSCLDFPNSFCPWPQGKMLGGSSANNGMQFILGNRRDFEIWKSMGNPTWGWNNVFEHFRKLEDYKAPNPYHVHGTRGPLVVDRFNGGLQEIKRLIFHAAKEGGYEFVDDFRDGHYLGYGLMNGLIINGQRNTPAKAFLQNIKPNLVVVKNAVATKINFDKDKNAQSVTFVYTDKDNVRHQLTAENSKEIILSAGTIESPKLLMLSGIGSRKHLESYGIPVISDLPVGENLKDHVAVTLVFKIETHLNNPKDTLYDYLIHRSGYLAGVNVLDAAGFVDVNNESGLYPTIQIHHLWYPKHTKQSEFAILGSLQQFLRDDVQETEILAMLFVLICPKSKGYIKLKSTDYLEQPEIFPNYLSEYEDVRLLREAIRLGIKLKKTPIFRKYGLELYRINHPKCDDFIFDTDEYWDCYIRHTNNINYHPAGTAKMGPINDKATVVDSRLRVKGVGRLRVIDASIMPEIVSANLQATVSVIGAKGADFIKEEWNN